MDTLVFDVNWLAVTVGAVAAFVLGWAWYSPLLFVKPWMKGCGLKKEDADQGRMVHAMIAQAGSTFLLSWLIGISANMESPQLAILVAFTCTGLVKANGLFGKKTMVAIAIESGFVLAMVAVMVLTHAIL